MPNLCASFAAFARFRAWLHDSYRNGTYVVPWLRGRHAIKSACPPLMRREAEARPVRPAGRAVVDVYMGSGGSPGPGRLTGTQATTNVVNNGGKKPCCEVL
jgi:hypothetical protein